MARRWAAAVWDPTPVSMRRIALAGVISSTVIIVTGAAVRLSKSGLGCPDWPQCTRSSLVAAPTRGDPMFHTWIEFGNRMVTVVVTVVAVAVLIAAWRFRPGGPGARRRPDLVWLAAAQPAGVVAQIVLGGIVVLTDLNPALVSLHFVVSVAVVAAAVALHVRCTEGTAPARSLVRPDLRLLGLRRGGGGGGDARRRDRGHRDRAAGRRRRRSPATTCRWRASPSSTPTSAGCSAGSPCRWWWGCARPGHRRG